MTIRQLAFVFLATFFVLLSNALPAQVRVNGYWKKNGTYVPPHYRSSPNSSKHDNYSTRGNYNPYTGRRGTQSPDPPTPRINYSYPTYRAPTTYGQSIAEMEAETRRMWAEVEAIKQRTYEARQQHLLRLQGEQSALAHSILSGERNPKSLSATELLLLKSALPTFRGYPCTSDCSGHEAGYEWAEDNGISDADDCDGNSQSFIEGCISWVEEQSEQQ